MFFETGFKTGFKIGFTKKRFEQKVLKIKVAGRYSTTKSIKGLEALALTSLEKIGLEFFPQKNSKSLSFFSPKIRGFLWGQTCSVGTSDHPSNHP